MVRQMEVSALNGIGPKTKEQLNNNGIYSVSHLIEYFPSRYEYLDLGLKEGKCTIKATVISQPKIAFFKRNLSAMTFKIDCEGQLINTVIYNRNYLLKQLPVGREVIIQGSYDKRMVASNLYFTYEPVKPHYRVKEIAQGSLRKYIKQALQFKDLVSETMALEQIEKYKLYTKSQLLSVVHNPRNKEDVVQIYRRSKYEEFLLYQLEMKYLRKFKKLDGIKVSFDSKVNDFLTALPYSLTSDQKEAIKVIMTDLNSEEAMNRLLQGDVGSGKTIVSIAGLLNCYLNGYQSVMMAPTEMLAEQHYKSIQNLLPDVNVILLTSSTKDELALKRIELENAIIIGTHALFQKDVVFNNLALVVTDEQHRFGVEQRKSLVQKGLRPNILNMSATPIPRTLAISIFGDIDVSSIQEMPKGRKPVETKTINFKELDEVVAVAQKEIDVNRQVYIVAPMIEESENVDAVNIHQTAEFFEKKLQGKTAILHGRMKTQEKEDIMKSFATGKVDCLISTTVIEVGMDVPNATLMVILNADRFGLSQLHQLRGRVGRGEHQSYCYLVSDSKNELTMDRLQVLVDTDNGFEISEADLKLRGPGDFLGSRQSGFPEFRFGDVFKDFKILDIARIDAEQIVYNIEDKKYEIYKKYLQKVLGGIYD